MVSQPDFFYLGMFCLGPAIQWAVTDSFVFFFLFMNMVHLKKNSKCSGKIKPEAPGPKLSPSEPVTVSVGLLLVFGNHLGP